MKQERIKPYFDLIEIYDFKAILDPMARFFIKTVILIVQLADMNNISVFSTFFLFGWADIRGSESHENTPPPHCVSEKWFSSALTLNVISAR